MDDNTIEIRDNEINVEEIMEKIRENIRRRKAVGELPPDPDSIVASSSDSVPPLLSDETIQSDFSCINSNWDIHNNQYFIRSHRAYLGKFLVKGRQLVHGEIRRYVDPMISSQTNFNASTVRILNQTSQKFSELDLKISRQRDGLTKKFSQQDEQLTQKFSQQEDQLTRKFSLQEDQLTRKFSQLDEQLTRKFSQLDDQLKTDIKNRVNSKFQEFFSQIDKDLKLQLGLSHILEKRIQDELAQKNPVPEPVTPQNINYFLFEERFRGSRDAIKQRQQEFIPYFEKSSRVLDIGCGRGEFLEILRDHNIGASGVDIDTDMVAYCRSRNLAVEQSDAIIYLEKLDDKSLDGIFIDQVVEHLEPEYLIRLLVLCYQKLKAGYYIVIETVNPLSFVSFVNFYIDMTHTKPVHPETLQYLMIAVGFRESEKKFISPVSDEARLKKISDIPQLDEPTRKSAEVYNYNIELLNSVLFGAQDYALIGKK